MITERGITPIPVTRPLLGHAEHEAMAAVRANGQSTQGEQVRLLEEEYAELVDGRHCIAVSSGTSALYLALLGSGIGRGDEVIVPSFTSVATANAVGLTGADPVFVDIDPGTFCIDPAAVADAITPRTAAIMPVHLFGHPAEMASLTRLAERFDLLLVEDAAQAHGATFDGRPVGALGDLAGFSFHSTNNLTTGEGGMVVARDAETARRIRLLRHQGMGRQFLDQIMGMNQRMTDLAAAIGRCQLRRLPELTAARRRNARTLDRTLRGVEQPRAVGPVQHVYHQYTVRHPDRELLIEWLARDQIGAAVPYPRATHLMPAYSDDPRWADLHLEHTERACAETLSLPVRPSLSDAELRRIIASVNSFAMLR